MRAKYLVLIYFILDNTVFNTWIKDLHPQTNNKGFEANNSTNTYLLNIFFPVLIKMTIQGRHTTVEQPQEQQQKTIGAKPHFACFPQNHLARN